MSSAHLDPRRVLRALGLSVEPLGGGQYRVTGGCTPHVVQAEGHRWICDCPDAGFRPRGRCKHVVAVYLARQLAGAVRAALREAVGATP